MADPMHRRWCLTSALCGFAVAVAAPAVRTQPGQPPVARPPHGLFPLVENAM